MKVAKKAKKTINKKKIILKRRNSTELFLDGLKSLTNAETGFASSQELKEKLGWEDEKYARVRVELIKTNEIIQSFGGPGGKLALARDQNQKPLNVFVSYSHADKKHLIALQKHLSLLKRLKLTETWIDQEITAGDSWDKKISDKMKSADIFLLLVSADFINSNYCYEVELDTAFDRQAKKLARVIPIIIRDCLWKQSRLQTLQVLPPEGKAVTSWSDEDSALTAVAKGIFDVATEMLANR